MARSRIATVFLLVFSTSVLWPQSSGFSLHVTPSAHLPVGTTAALYSFGGSVGLSGEYSLPSLPVLFGKASVSYAFARTTTGAMLSLIPMGVGAGVRFQPLGRIELEAATWGGYFIGMMNEVVGGSAFVSAELLATFLITPSFGLGVGGSYNHYFGPSGALYQGIGGTIGVSYRVGAAARQPRIELRDPAFPPVFPVFYSHYDDHPVGTATLVNREKSPIRDLTVSFFVEQYMTGPKLSATIAELGRAGSATVDLYALFTDQVLTVTEGKKVAAKILLDYTYSGQPFHTELSQTLELHHRNAMTWDDDNRAAAFVTARDPAVLRFSKNVASVVRGEERPGVSMNLRMAIALFEALSLHGMSYVVDPSTPYAEYSVGQAAVDYLAFPRQSLSYKAGDCDDLSILYCALLESIGIPAAFITAPGHIYTAVKLEIDPKEAKGTFSNPADLIVLGQEVWVPVEITLVGKEFLRAWQSGATEWREFSPQGRAGFFPIRTAWESYRPVALVGEEAEAPIPDLDPEALRARYVGSLNAFLQREIVPQVQALRQRMAESPDDPRLPNRLGLLYARFGLLAEAEKEFRRIVDRQTEYVPALLNMGNIYLLRDDPDQALVYYRHAERLKPGDPTVLLNLSKALHRLEDFAGAAEAYARLRSASPALAEKHAYLGSAADEARAAQVGLEVMEWTDED